MNGPNETLTQEELEAQQKAWNDFFKSLDAIHKAISKFADALMKWEEEHHDEIIRIKRELDRRKKEVSK